MDPLDSLLKGIGVQFAPEVPGGDAVSINSGTYLDLGPNGNRRCFLPKPDWRPLTASERELLLGPTTECVSILQVGADLQADFAESIVPRLFGPDPVPPDEAKTVLNRFAERMAGSLNGPGLSLRPVVCNATVNPPGMPSTGFDYEHRVLVGLHFDNREEHFHLLAVNLGQAHRYLNFVNVERTEMAKLMEMEKELPMGSGSPASRLKDAFCSRFPSYPVIRIRLEPRHAYLLNPQTVIHDGATNELEVPDLNFLMLARMSFGAERPAPERLP